jgi:hypothetical protein
MQIHIDRSTDKPTAPEEYYDLLYCRMSMLGLDLPAVEAHDPEIADQIKQRCTLCGFREACAVDLERDPNNPVWEAYCPNSATFNMLAETIWRAR